MGARAKSNDIDMAKARRVLAGLGFVPDSYTFHHEPSDRHVFVELMYAEEPVWEIWVDSEERQRVRSKDMGRRVVQLLEDLDHSDADED
jgi:hypothetical protein